MSLVAKICKENVDKEVENIAGTSVSIMNVRRHLSVNLATSSRSIPHKRRREEEGGFAE